MILSKCKDNQLIDFAVRGNQQAYSILTERHYRKIRLLIYLYVHESNIANDLTQDVFIRVYQYLPLFKKQCEFTTWLYRVALNTVKNYFRLVQKRQECVLDENEVIHDESYSPETISIGLELIQQIQYAFSKLPEGLRECYFLHAMDGKSYEEISKKLDCPLGTVRSRIFRARKLLKEAI